MKSSNHPSGPFTRSSRGIVDTYLVGWLLLQAIASIAQLAPTDIPYAVTERNMDCRVWQRTVQTTDPVTGQSSQQLQSYSELGNGICYQTADGSWVDSQNLVESTPTGAQAVHGALQGYFNADINSANAIRLVPTATLSPTASPIQSSPVGLFYFDPLLGKVARIASIQHSQGVLHPPNVVVYPDVLDTVKADLMVVWANNGCEDSLVLRESPPPPQSFGLTAAARLQYWATIDCPEPKEQRPVQLPSGLVDHILIFDGYWLPVGRAFLVGDTPVPTAGQPAQLHLVSASDSNSVCLAKSLVNISGQHVLIHEVNYSDLLPAFNKLGHASISPKTGKALAMAARGQLLPKRSGANLHHGVMEIASTRYVPTGIVFDPLVMLNGTATNKTFLSGNTYSIPTSFYVGPGSVTFQANVIFKFGSGAWLLVYGPLTFPSSGSPIVFTSKDDNSLSCGFIVPGSTSEPGYAASYALWIYYPTFPTIVQNTVFRWAQRAIEYDENASDHYGHSLSSSIFQNCNIGVNLNMQSDTLSLTSDSYCDVIAPCQTDSYHGTVVGSIAKNCGTPNEIALIDASTLSGIEGEPAIAVNPKNPLNLFVAANYSPDGLTGDCRIFNARSMDGGITWTRGSDLQNSWEDPSVAFDEYGNLFVSFIDPTAKNAYEAISIDGGASFIQRPPFNDNNNQLDQPTTVTGPGTSGNSSVWITFFDGYTDDIVVSGAAVTGTFQVGSFSALTHIPNSFVCNWGDIAVGQTGQVAVVFQTVANLNGPSDLRLSLNPYGISNPSGFTSATKILTTQAGSWQRPPATPNRGLDVECGLAWDRTGGQYRGRLYLVYIDRPINDLNNTDIYVVHSDDNGTTWSTPAFTTVRTLKGDPSISARVYAGWMRVPGVIDLKYFRRFGPAASLPNCGDVRWKTRFCAGHRSGPSRAISPVREALQRRT